MCEIEGGWSIFYRIQDNGMKRCQGLTLDKMNRFDKMLSPISHVIVNDIKFPYFSLGLVHTNLTQIDIQNDAWMVSCTRNSTRNQLEWVSRSRDQ